MSASARTQDVSRDMRVRTTHGVYALTTHVRVCVLACVQRANSCFISEKVALWFFTYSCSFLPFRFYYRMAPEPLISIAEAEAYLANPPLQGGLDPKAWGKAGFLNRLIPRSITGVELGPKPTSFEVVCYVGLGHTDTFEPSFPSREFLLYTSEGIYCLVRVGKYKPVQGSRVGANPRWSSVKFITPMEALAYAGTSGKAKPNPMSHQEAMNRFWDAFEKLAGEKQLVFVGPFQLVGDRKGGILAKLEVKASAEAIAGRPAVHIAFIGVKREDRKKGYGDKVMRMLIQAADVVGLGMDLEVDPQTEYGEKKPAMNERQLTKFYAKYGFVSGEDGYMRRLPR